MKSRTTILLIIAVIVFGCKIQAADGDIDRFQGSWLIVSSSGKANGGHVFYDKIGKKVVVKGNVISVPSHKGSILSKKLIVRPDIASHAYDIKPVKPKWKTWSRVAIIKVEGDKMYLCINFPQKPHPKTFKAGNDGREYIVLKRLK